MILAERRFSVAADLTWSDGAAPRGPLSSLQLRGNVGTLVHRGRPLEALVAEQIPYGLHRVAMVVAPAGDDLVVVFAYCDQGRLVRLYQESFAGGGFQELVNPGECRFERRDFVFRALHARGHLIEFLCARRGNANQALRFCKQ